MKKSTVIIALLVFNYFRTKIRLAMPDYGARSKDGEFISPKSEQALKPSLLLVPTVSLAKRVLVLCTLFVLALTPQTSNACSWFEDNETVRLALFRAELEGAAAFRPFLYSSNFYNSSTVDPEQVDRKRNCREWQQKLGADVQLNDIDFILYHTDPAVYAEQLEKDCLAIYFEGNTFIEKLLEDKNKPILDYLTFAKELEQRSYPSAGKQWENWDNLYSYGSEAEQSASKDDAHIYALLPTLKDDFLRQRYAFLLLRIANDETSGELYDQYLSGENLNTIIQPWAMLAKAGSFSPDKKAAANYYYSLSFDRCEEKKLACIRRSSRDQSTVKASLCLAKNDHQRAVILAMQSLRNPGPGLTVLKKIQALAPESRYVSILITREINKLEDWIFTPKLTEYDPSVYPFKDRKVGYDSYQKHQTANLAKDMAYLGQLKAYLKQIQGKAKGDQRHFLSLAIAHLAFMDDDLSTGNRFLGMIPDEANQSILSQKMMDQVLVALKTENLDNAATQQKLLATFRHFEKIAPQNPDSYKSMYSLLRLVSKAYEKKGDGATAGLLFMKSEYYKYQLEQEDWSPWSHWDYWFIAYFDRKANVEDMDTLLALIAKKKKTPYEAYLCEQHWGNTEIYKDVKVTLAFRNNDLKLAAATLAKIPESFYDSTYAYRDYLDENPFYPKVLQSYGERDHTYKFSKREFIDELISLEKEAKNGKNQAANYLKLGHAYFNCSYYGNSWMMVSYGWSRSDYPSIVEYIFSPISPQRATWQNGNYYNCTLAKSYYEKALAVATKEEDRAMAALMIHTCDYSAFQRDETQKTFTKTAAIKEFAKYDRTDVYLRYRDCAGIGKYID